MTATVGPLPTITLMAVMQSADPIFISELHVIELLDSCVASGFGTKSSVVKYVTAIPDMLPFNSTQM